MKDVYLIGCVGEKVEKHPGCNEYRADELYMSDLFEKELEYARVRATDNNIFIISAKYHLISLDTRIRGYNVTLENMFGDLADNWGKTILNQLKERFDENCMKETKFVILAGDNYVAPLGIDKDDFDSDEPNGKSHSQCIRHWIRPVRKGLRDEGHGSGIGCQLGWLTDNMYNLNV